MAAPIFKRIAEQTLPYIDRIGLFDSSPKKKRRTNHQFTDRTTRITNNGGTQITDNKANLQGSSSKSSQSSIKHTPISDETLVKNGEGNETPKPSGRN